MRVLISGGGTGGHVYPALAVAEKLLASANPAVAQAATSAEAPAPQVVRPSAVPEADALPAARRPSADGQAVGHELLWVGSVDGMEESLVTRAGIAFHGIRSGQLRGMHPLRAATNVARIMAGVGQALRTLDRFRPEVCFVTGGYVCVPVVLACRLRGVPVAIFLPDVTPGAAIRLLSRMAQRVAVTVEEAALYFGGLAPEGKAVVTGYPVRPELEQASADKTAARRALAAALQRPALADDRPLLLVWGGSQGARSINRATWAALDELSPLAQILHVVGDRDWSLYEAEHAATAATAAGRYHAVPYLHEAMSLALTGADLTVARAGASSLGELPIASLPAILVPLPYGDQWRNAEVLARRGAAVVIEDGVLEQRLAETVGTLLRDRDRMGAMAAAATSLARPQAAQEIAELLLKLK